MLFKTAILVTLLYGLAAEPDPDPKPKIGIGNAIRNAIAGTFGVRGGVRPGYGIGPGGPLVGAGYGYDRPYVRPIGTGYDRPYGSIQGGGYGHGGNGGYGHHPFQRYGSGYRRPFDRQHDYQHPGCYVDCQESHCVDDHYEQEQHCVYDCYEVCDNYYPEDYHLSRSELSSIVAAQSAGSLGGRLPKNIDQKSETAAEANGENLEDGDLDSVDSKSPETEGQKVKFLYSMVLPKNATQARNVAILATRCGGPADWNGQLGEPLPSTEPTS